MGVAAPPIREAGGGDGGDGEAAVLVVGGVVEEREPGAGGVAEIDDVKRGGALVEVVAVAARVEAEEGAEQEADGGFVGDDEDAVVRVGADDFHERRQGAGGDGEAALAAARGEGERVAVPFLRLLGELALDFLAGHLLPAAMGDFAETVDGLDGEGWGWARMEAVSMVRPERRGVDGGELFAAEALGEAADLLAAFIGKGDVGGAGEPIFGGEDGGAVADEEDAGVVDMGVRNYEG